MLLQTALLLLVCRKTHTQLAVALLRLQTLDGGADDDGADGPPQANTNFGEMLPPIGRSLPLALDAPVVGAAEGGEEAISLRQRQSKHSNCQSIRSLNLTLLPR